MKNKKSLISLEGLVRIIIAVVLFLFVFGACSKAKSGLSDQEGINIISFEDFVNGVNGMRSDTTKKSFSITLKKDTAIIGFIKDTLSDPKDWKCRNCHGEAVMTFNKPSNSECNEKACVCLCTEGFNFDRGSNFISCGSLRCKTLTKDISERIDVRTDYLGSNTYWENGFLFANDISQANGLNKYKPKDMDIFVDKVDDKITVCNSEMKRYVEDNCCTNSCIIPDVCTPCP